MKTGPNIRTVGEYEEKKYLLFAFSVVSRSARTETDLLDFLVTLAFLLTEATRGRPASGSFSVLLSSKLARLAMLLKTIIVIAISFSSNLLADEE